MSRLIPIIIILVIGYFIGVKFPGIANNLGIA